MVSQLPAFAMQALVFGGIMAVLLYFMAEGGGVQTALPMISLYTLAGYRLMPALQAAYGGLSSMRSNQAVLDAVHGELCTPAHDGDRRDGLPPGPVPEAPLGLSDGLRLIGLSYRYPASDRAALNGINLKIRARTRVGLVGPTGSGKTTLVDLILGLLKPEAGALVVDGKPISGRTIRAWQLGVGYVPQQIFLADDSIRANIAFGIPSERIDQAAVERAARTANLHAFVSTELKDGYATLVGERGIRLSGGQRQRIGIARALYRDPDVLIFDEATAALDNLTEHAVMDAVHALASRKTIILIAHRLSTVRDCDKIFYLQQGRVAAAGTYDELLAESPEFRRLAGTEK